MEFCIVFEVSSVESRENLRERSCAEFEGKIAGFVKCKSRLSLEPHFGETMASPPGDTEMIDAAPAAPAVAVVDKGKARELVDLSDNLPFVEKYRPKTLDDVVAHQDIISTSTQPAVRSERKEKLMQIRSRPIYRQESIPAFTVLWTAWNGKDFDDIGCREKDLWNRYRSAKE